ncbi:DUF4367 domain-containing protein [Pontibacillus salipaludis]|uniref:DUF4367 domain-containing protein n=1 Tax=Pontibacillus salipaludis TaxID=1697394 RepID=A0ABQ1Q8V5_9BACI|nr:DUF4367 domain-containing protein [Pontibacillus salipaludis]GGD18573.1 hypothetical protein GCM10011389_27850 [Pontibacillus salipaludis]
MNNIREEFEKIEIPDELNSRVASGVQQAKREKKRKSKYPNWVLGAVASIMIVGIGSAMGGSYIVDAAESLLNQLFGSKEKLMEAYPDESSGEISFMEQHLEFAEENLTEEEFTNLSDLYKEQAEIWREVRAEDRSPDVEEAARLHEIKELQLSYENQFALKEAQHLSSYTVTQPTYVPEGYKQTKENFFITGEGDEPVVTFDYSKGDVGYTTYQQEINQTDDFEYIWGNFENTKSYSLSGHEFIFKYSEENQATGLRVKVPDQGFKITLLADTLSKEEAEKVVLSMLE